nr:MAG TPA: hypothetical protein [Caudoviricetes sp.]
MIMEIVSGRTGKPHVTSQQFRQLIEGTVGQESCILTSGENLEPELASNNSLKIRSGMLAHHGNISSVKIGTYDAVNLSNGSQGMKRIDLVVCRYTRNAETEVESCNWVVIMGTPAASNPVAPAYTVGNLQDGDLVDDCPVFEVHYDGINVTEVRKILSVVPNLTELNSNKKVECFSKTVATDVDLLVDFSAEVNSIIKNGGKIVSAIPGTTTNSNNALVYGKVAIQALPDWSEVYVRCNSNYYSGLGGTTTLTLLVVYE